MDIRAAISPCILCVSLLLHYIALYFSEFRYQVLPGPEATELSCYFGYLARGRLGAILGGLGFMTPGFVLMLFFAWLYVDYGLQNEVRKMSFNSSVC